MKSIDIRQSRCILFDWGDTLMRVFPEYNGPMVDWPHIEAIPHAEQVLTSLHPSWTLALATNAQASGETEIRAALDKVNLAGYLDKIYCYKIVGYKKPSKEYFDFILRDLRLDPSQVIMVGDQYEADIQGANLYGISAVWFREHSNISTGSPLYQTIHDLRELPEALSHFWSNKDKGGLIAGSIRPRRK